MTKKIMIIDDEPDIRIYLMTILEDEGYQTCTVEENDRIAEEVLKQRPDLIILDIMMPKRSGISIYKELRTLKELAGIPVALISGMVPEKDFIEKEFRKLVNDYDILPPDGYIEKPVQVEALIDMSKKLIKQ